jgi:DNA-binding NtrC family response regulator
LSRLEHARGGTLYLEHVDALDAHAEMLLLGRLSRLDQDGIRVIVSAENAQSHGRDEVAQQTITVPPLRERRGSYDILALAAMFLHRYGANRHVRLSSEAAEHLVRYDYPGNVTELERTIEYVLGTTQATIILARHLPETIRAPGKGFSERERARQPRGQENAIALYNALREHFSLQELRTLAFRLGIDYEDVPAETPDEMARDLIRYCERRLRLPELVSAAQERCPDVAWGGDQEGR